MSLSFECHRKRRKERGKDALTSYGKAAACVTDKETTFTCRRSCMPYYCAWTLAIIDRVSVGQEVYTGSFITIKLTCVGKIAVNISKFCFGDYYFRKAMSFVE